MNSKSPDGAGCFLVIGLVMGAVLWLDHCSAGWR